MHGINGGTGAAYHSCMKCDMEGERLEMLQKPVHSLFVANLRTPQSYAADARTAEETGKVCNGVHYLSEWDRLPNFDSITCALAGTIHIICKLYAYNTHIVTIAVFSYGYDRSYAQHCTTCEANGSIIFGQPSKTDRQTPAKTSRHGIRNASHR